MRTLLISSAILILMWMWLCPQTFIRLAGKRFGCRLMGWHLEPYKITSDGVTGIGHCPRCGKKVGLDSQGNWFEMRDQS